MKVTIGKDGLVKSWQKPFSEETKCWRCSGVANLAFVAHEGIEEEVADTKLIASLYENIAVDGTYWLHDRCAVAVYFCRHCLAATAVYNQA